MESLDSFKDTDNCELRSSQEPLSKYQKGGFHPLCLGETLRDERYTVKHKLGWGGFSTVWLAWDNHIRNIAYTLPQVPTFNLMDHLDQPQVHDLVLKSGEGLPPGFPTQIVKAAEWKTQDIFDEADIRLLDFGDTFEQGHEPDHLAQPNSLRAPETILTDGFDFKVDLWDVGVTIYEIIFRDPPFMYLGDEEGFIASMLAFIGGEMPKEWDEVYREIHRKGGREWEVFENVPESKPGLERKFESLEDKSLKPLLAILQVLGKARRRDI
ncbi:putative protein kinase dsk1 [Glarea lozoyensis 74030]|uniref:non-specific serine/threonine protein kinase n=1 Tax=Glarea lozoyensis (strain ATCC 74030 / MF5533) TaxID=1104152 RepID=H0EUY6_GLAL7|nr:putative protein kinase dsk1 [Glarea lozoyensis 74030]